MRGAQQSRALVDSTAACKRTSARRLLGRPYQIIKCFNYMAECNAVYDLLSEHAVVASGRAQARRQHGQRHGRQHAARQPAPPRRAPRPRPHRPPPPAHCWTCATCWDDSTTLGATLRHLHESPDVYKLEFRILFTCTVIIR